MSAEILSTRTIVEIIWLCTNCDLTHKFVITNGKPLRQLECYSCNTIFHANKVNLTPSRTTVTRVKQ